MSGGAKAAVFTLVAVLVGGVGCGGSDRPSGSGTLSVDVSGAPSGTTTAVHVRGAGVDQQLTMSQSLALASGSYTVTADLITEPDPLIRQAYAANIASSPAAVCGKAPPPR